jgi:ABC-type lipoprotein export system ATPase subunit
MSSQETVISLEIAEEIEIKQIICCTHSKRLAQNHDRIFKIRKTEYSHHI